MNEEEYFTIFKQKPLDKYVRNLKTTTIPTWKGDAVEKVFVFEYCPSPLRVYELEIRYSSGRTMSIMMPENQLFAEQGSDLFAWAATRDLQ